MIKQKIFKLGLKDLADFMRHGFSHHFKVIQGLPADARIIAVRVDQFSNGRALEVLVESDTYPEVKEGDPIPAGDDVLAQDAKVREDLVMDLVGFLSVIQTAKEKDPGIDIIAHIEEYRPKLQDLVESLKAAGFMPEKNDGGKIGE